MIESKEPPVRNSVEALDLVMHNRSVCGLHVGLVCENAPLRVKACMEELFTWCIEGRIEPVVHAVYTFDQVSLWW